eukprot:2215923-Pyramimonas_sp.AAC.1
MAALGAGVYKDLLQDFKKIREAVGAGDLASSVFQDMSRMKLGLGKKEEAGAPAQTLAVAPRVEASQVKPLLATLGKNFKKLVDFGSPWALALKKRSEELAPARGEDGRAKSAVVPANAGGHPTAEEPPKPAGAPAAPASASEPAAEAPWVAQSAAAWPPAT